MLRPGRAPLSALAAAAALLAAGTLGTACSGGSAQTTGTTFISAGQVPRADLPQVGKNSRATKSTGTTIPLGKENPINALFTAMGQFSSCLTGMGMTFIGIPSRTNPHSATNSPAYITALKTCAANSNILQALKSAQSAQDNLTPAQVKKRNEQYLKWRSCMLSRGWTIPEPTPNAKGLLFTFSPSGGGGGGGTGGGGGKGVGGFKAPPGQSIMTSPDLAACAAKAQQEVPT
jgi:hypothetical protein